MPGVRSALRSSRYSVIAGTRMMIWFEKRVYKKGFFFCTPSFVQFDAVFTPQGVHQLVFLRLPHVPARRLWNLLGFPWGSWKQLHFFRCWCVGFVVAAVVVVVVVLWLLLSLLLWLLLFLFVGCCLICIVQLVGIQMSCVSIRALTSNSRALMHIDLS